MVSICKRAMRCFGAPTLRLTNLILHQKDGFFRCKLQAESRGFAYWLTVVTEHADVVGSTIHAKEASRRLPHLLCPLQLFRLIATQIVR